MGRIEAKCHSTSYGYWSMPERATCIINDCFGIAQTTVRHRSTDQNWASYVPCRVLPLSILTYSFTHVVASLCCAIPHHWWIVEWRNTQQNNFKQHGVFAFQCLLTTHWSFVCCFHILWYHLRLLGDSSWFWSAGFMGTFVATNCPPSSISSEGGGRGTDKLT